MNVDRINRLANYIENMDTRRFDMRKYLMDTDCGTVGCIGGWCTYLFEGMPVASALGLDEEQAMRMIIPGEPGANWLAFKGEKAHISSSRAARQLRYLAEHGEVNWSKTP